MKKTITIVAFILTGFLGYSQTNLTTIYSGNPNSATITKNVLYTDASNLTYATDFIAITQGTNTATNALLVNGTFTQTGGKISSYLEKSASYTVVASDYYINCITDTFNVQLPTAVGRTGQIYVITSSDAGSVTATTTSSQTINGSSTKVVTTKKTLWVISNGSNWIILSFS